MSSVSNIKLPNAPLQEVILDVKWNLDFDTESNLEIDKGFENAFLKFTQFMHDSYTDIEILKPELLPSIAFNYKPIYRFRKPNSLFPLYQLGPGIFSVNSNNEHYTWDDYLLLIQEGIQNLKKSYKKELIIKQIDLRYIDSVAIGVLGNCTKFEFLENHLNVKAERYSFSEGELEGVNYIKKFRLSESSSLLIDIATGHDANTMQEIIYWKTSIQQNGNINWKEFETWLDMAHKTASTTFKKMINKELYDYFSNQ